MIFYCTNCWSEIQKDKFACPNCGANQHTLRKESFTDKLINALNHPEPSTPIRAANILGKLKSKEAIPFLINRLEKERDPFIIKAFVDALLNLDAANTKKLILKILAENPPVTVKREIEELGKNCNE